jgi:CRISPR/Cas system-associated endonuclease Cas1
LILTRAEASRKLRHVIVCGREGGFVTFPALMLLRDTGTAFSQIDWNGTVVIASGPRGPDQAALRRAQVLVCSGAQLETAVAVTREILRLKLRGQAHVLKLVGAAAAGEAIDALAIEMTPGADGARVLSLEAQAASIYWKSWENIPVRFARQNPQRLDTLGRWRPGRPENWLIFGPRASILTGRPFRATSPGNALLNFLYAILETEMTIALHGAGLDPGIGLFHADVDRRASLALDAIEAVRPYVDAWLVAYLATSVFANRDFTELADGEIRLTHPLNSHLAHSAAVWRRVCEPVAKWLAQCFENAIKIEFGAASEISIPAYARAGSAKPPPHVTRKMELADSSFAAAALPSFFAPARPWLATFKRTIGLRDNPVPGACIECGRALAPSKSQPHTVGRRKFCSASCAGIYRAEMRKVIPVHGEVAARVLASVQAGDELRKVRLARSIAARSAWERAHGIEPAGKDDTRRAAERAGLQQWFATEIGPRLSGLRTIDVTRALDISRVYARKIVRGEQIPHPRHFAALAKLAGVEAPAL